jgi:hypothetical protein
MMDMRDRDNAPAPALPISGAGATLGDMTANAMRAAAKAPMRRPGRPRGSRNSDTVGLLARLGEYREAGIDLVDALASIAEDRRQPWGVRLAAARHVCGLLLARVGSPPG